MSTATTGTAHGSAALEKAALEPAALEPAATADARRDSTERAAMVRALDLALLGPAGGLNPRVGCVLLAADGRVLAEGHHAGAGTPHAEVDALAKADPDAVRGGTAVVTLEPCDHVGRTGPCSVALIEAGIARVVFAQPDPNTAASGGAARLARAGVDVERGLLAELAAIITETWAASVALGRPWVTLKWASSLDGRVAAADGTSRWITGPAARADVHRRRAEHGAVLVGTGTALTDDPALTARDETGRLLPHQPLPVVVGRRELPADAALRSHPRTLVTDSGDDLDALLQRILDAGARSVLVEGGPRVASAFLAAGLVDEVVAYLAPTLLGGPRLATTDLGVGTIGEQHRLTLHETRAIGQDVLVVARPKSPTDDEEH